MASSVRTRVARRPMRSFLSAADVPGPRRAVESELSRLAAVGELARVRKGLYWKGPKTQLGVAPPRPLAVALRVAGPGSGPAGFTAAAVLGLTTQVPATLEVAVPGKAPVPPPGVRFTQRDISRRDLKLTSDEVAVLEVLRDWPATVEVDWAMLASSVRALVERHAVRIDRVGREVQVEHRRSARAAWDRLYPLVVSS